MDTSAMTTEEVRLEGARQRLAFWKDVYVAAVHAGNAAPRAVADQASSDYDEACAAERVRVELERPPAPAWRAEADAHLRNNKKVAAVKVLRAHVPGLRLKDSKMLVEERMRTGHWPESVRVSP